MRYARYSLVLLVSALLMGCAATAIKIPDVTSDTMQRLSHKQLPTSYSEFKQAPINIATDSTDNNGKVLIDWWTTFGDPVLNDFVNQAIKLNDDIAIAIAKVEQARAVAVRSAVDIWPTIDIGSSATQQRQSLQDNQNRTARNQPGFSRDSTTYRADMNVSWETDLFGRKAALSAASVARAEASQADADAVRLTTVAEVARNVITARSLQQRIKLAEDAAAIETEIVDVIRAKARGGQVSTVDIQRAVALENTALAEAAQLKSEYASTVQALAILLAATPDAIFTKLLAPIPASPVLSISQAGLPADLLRRRPDIRRAEHQLDAASKELAASHADRFPKLNLGGTVALIAGTLSGLNTADAVFRSIAPSLSWRVLDFGRLDADIVRAKGIEKEALIRYRQTITVAFAEADTALSDLKRRETTYLLRLSAVNTQRDALEIITRQYERGLIDFTAALEAKRALTQSQNAAALAAQSQLIAAVTAYRTLGGGW